MKLSRGSCRSFRLENVWFSVQSLKDLKLELLQKKERYENLSSFSQMKEELEKLNKKMAWCLVRLKR